jgi:hypothetical protein
MINSERVKLKELNSIFLNQNNITILDRSIQKNDSESENIKMDSKMTLLREQLSKFKV